ncbi:GlxA family transcriptional regulator [Fulvivirga ligni]|uniref:GlxA family transcriptional regulator n=1 Tax=Fulvivirga ligni TaxID=2904246 RepID=UPI001F3467E9|nr:helix-turn-helix domain-containing protein [Fulvivirga ligni]UII22082.1 helix-turn-helix domain-containing protein [Fulvivirga ligni]
MKSISILVPESSVMESIGDPQYLFTVINQFLESEGKSPAFDVQLVGATKEVVLKQGLVTIRPQKLLDEVKETDLIIIPALAINMKTAIEANQEMIPWIIKHYKKGTEVASLCVGAFLLGSTGLLDGYKCSTHWAFANEFRSMFPEINLVDGGIITEENGIYTSGGANSYWNLLLYLVEKFTDRHKAILASKYFAIDIDRDSQASFSLFQGQKEHNDEAIKSAQTFIEEHYQEKFSVDDLAEQLALSRRSLERRFKKATNNTIIEYAQRVKIEVAKRNFELSRKNISEVMYDVGYSDTKAFRTVFKKITGLTPIEYRNKYNKQPVLA